LSLPFEWQDAVIRSAITLKLCSYEETGAIVAAITTSIPEAPHTPRNWDYRYCWLRDAHFSVAALVALAKFDVLEDFVRFIINVVQEQLIHGNQAHLQPLFSVDMNAIIPERTEACMAGYRQMGPVRVGNLAYFQQRNDTYGAVVLACAHAFFDSRLRHFGTMQLFERLVLLARMGYKLYDKPDAGLWEFRGIRQVHTYSAVMCWASCDRVARIAKHIGRTAEADEFRRLADELHDVICTRSWNAEKNSFVSTFEGTELDACLLCWPNSTLSSPLTRASLARYTRSPSVSAAAT